MFEAILHKKIKHFNYIKNLLSIKTKELLKNCQQCVKFETLIGLVNRLKPNELVPGRIGSNFTLAWSIYSLMSSDFNAMEIEMVFSKL